MESVLITGGAGYIGSHAAKAVHAAGYTPVKIDNLSRGHTDAVKCGPLEGISLEDKESLQSVFSRYKPVAVMHFAAYAYVSESTSDPFSYYRNNVCGTLTLLEAIRNSSCDKLIFSSTCAVYGTPNVAPIDELAPRLPINPYGMTKLMVEQTLVDADMTYGLKSAVLRYFNAAGADPDGELGEHHDPETHLIPLAIRAAIGAGAPLKVFGSDYPTRDGSCIRDYCRMTDIASAHVLALEYLVNGGNSDAFNLGSETGASIFEVIAAAEKVSEKMFRLQLCQGAQAIRLYLLLIVARHV